MDGPAVAVKHEIGVPEELRVAFLKGEDSEVSQRQKRSSLAGDEQS